MTRTFISAAAALLLTTAALTPAAIAAPASVSVTYGDLDLRTDQGRDVLAARVQQAAQKICGPVDYPLDAHGTVVYEAERAHSLCLRKTALSVSSQIDAAREASAGKTQKLAGK